jgi:organic radical activating enzyme
MAANRDKENFLYPYSSYRGDIKPENLVFNSNLQEFAQKVSYICNLETNGKLPPNAAYKQIKALWKELKQSKKQLGIGDNRFKNDDKDDDNSNA